MYCKNKQEDSIERLCAKMWKMGRNPSIGESWDKLWKTTLQQSKNKHFDDHSMTCGEKRKMTKSNYFLITFKNEKNSNDDL